MASNADGLVIKDYNLGHNETLKKKWWAKYFRFSTFKVCV